MFQNRPQNYKKKSTYANKKSFFIVFIWYFEKKVVLLQPERAVYLSFSPQFPPPGDPKNLLIFGEKRRYESL